MNIVQVVQYSSEILDESSQQRLSKEKNYDTTKINCYKNESESMSLCISLVTKNRIVLMTDSRSTYVDKNTFIDGFKKIVYLPIAKMAFICSGTNIVDGENITDFIANHEHDISNDSAQDVLKKMAVLLQGTGFQALINLCVNQINHWGIRSFYLNFSSDSTNMEVMSNKMLWSAGNYNIINLLYKSENGDFCVPNLETYSEKQAIAFFISSDKNSASI